MAEIAGILLSAGSATRFGSNKLLHPLPEGTPVAVQSARRLVEAVPNSIAVIRPDDEELRQALDSTGIGIIENPVAGEGMGTTIARGVLATRNAAGWIIALADMPWIEPATIVAVTALLRQGASMAAPAHAGRRGHPVGFSRSWREELCGLSGDSGARGVIEAHPDMLELVETGDPGIFRDIDYPQDLPSSA
jgi:molybdenum cofactor cytidylyltransferase